MSSFTSTSTSSPEYDAVRYNNHGVSLLTCGKYHQAVQYFTESLFLTKQIMANCEQAQKAQAQASESSACCSSSSSSSAVLQKEQLQGQQQQVQQEEDDSFSICFDSDDDEDDFDDDDDAMMDDDDDYDDDYDEEECYQHRPYCGFVPSKVEGLHNDKGYIFTSPIYIDDDGLEGAPIQCSLRLSFIVMFNLALSHHMLALSTNNKNNNKEEAAESIENLKKAKKLYQLAYGIHMQDEVDVSLYQIIPIINNLSQVHLALQNVQDAHLCCKHLLSALAYVRESQQQQQQAQYQARPMMDQQLEGYFSNVMHLVLVDGQVATAA